MKKEFEKLFLSQPSIIQERTWMHLNEWRSKIYQPLLELSPTEIKDFGISGYHLKLNNLIAAIKEKDLDKLDIAHQVIGDIGKLNKMLNAKNGAGSLLFKRMFTGYRDCFGWTLLASGHITDINDCFSNCVGVWNHYINSNSAFVNEFSRSQWLDGAGYWPKVSKEMLETLDLLGASNDKIFDVVGANRKKISSESLRNFIDFCKLLNFEDAVIEALNCVKKESPLLSEKPHSIYKRTPVFWGISAPGGYSSILSKQLFEKNSAEIISIIEHLQLEKSLKTATSKKGALENEFDKSALPIIPKVDQKKARFL